MLKTLLVSSLFVVSAAFADHHGNKGEHHGPCHEDMKNLCGKAEGKEDKMRCMEESKDLLSQECKANMAKMKEAMSEVQEACKADIETYCKDMTPGDGLIKCMHKNRKKLSKECRNEMKEKREMRKKLKKGES